MTSTPVLSVTDDFNGDFQPEYFNQFTDYVNNSGQIAATMLYVLELVDDDVTCQFDATIDSTEYTALQALAGSFVYVAPIYYNNVDTLKSNLVDVNATSYFLVATYPYPGSGVTQIIRSLIVVSNKDSAVTSYDVRLEDITNSQTICEANFTNNVQTVNYMSTISNLPSDKAMLEVQVKKTGGTGSDYVHIYAISIGS